MQGTSFLTRFAQELESDLRTQLETASITDEDDFKDLINKILVTFDPQVIREQVRQAFLGAYTVDFILWRGLIAIEARFVQDQSKADETMSELISLIPVLGGIYHYFIFLILCAQSGVGGFAEMKSNLEAKSDQLKVIMITKRSS
jgi:hypothetical protein